MERYMAFSIGLVQFLDSFQFIMKSLDNIVATLNKDDFVYTKQLFSEDEKFYLMTRKGVFPYDFFLILTRNFSIHHSRRETHFSINCLIKNAP